MKRQSILVAVLSMLLVLSVALAGCAGGGTATATEAPTAAPTAAATAGTDDPTDAPDGEVYTVSWAMWDMATLNPSERTTAYAFEKMGIIIDPISLSWDTGGEQTKLFAATDSMPDCVSTYTASDLARFYSWIDQGIIRDIPEDMAAQYKNVKASMDAYLSLQAVKKIKDGKIWFIPRADFADPTMYTGHRYGTYFRTDWAKTLGFDTDKLESALTLDEYYEVMKAFTFNDPDGNGVNDTYGLTAEGGLSPLITAAHGVSPGNWILDESDGLYKPNYISNKTQIADIYKFHQKLYQEGILDPEFLNNGYKEALGKITMGTAGSLTRNGDDGWIVGTYLNYWYEANKDKGDPLNFIGLMAIPTAYEGQTPSLHSYLQTCGTEIASHVDDGKLNAILRAQDWMLSPEALEYKVWGFEGEDYNVVDGKKVKVPADQKPVYESYRLPGSLADWGMTSWLNEDLVAAQAAEYEANQGLPAENYMRIVEKTRAFRAYRNSIHDPSLNDLSINYISTPAKDELALDWGNRLLAMVTDGSDIDAGLDALIEEYLAKGLQTAIDELNALV